MPLENAFAARLLRSSVRAYAAAVAEELRRAAPHLVERGLPSSFANPLEDVEVRLLHLAEAVAFDRPDLLRRSVEWYKIAFHHREVPAEYLPATLETIAAVLQRELPATAAKVAVPHVRNALAGLPGAPVDLPMVLSTAAPHGELAAQFLLAVLEGRGGHAVQLVRAALARGVDIAELHDHVLTPVQREVGRMWLMCEVPIADEHYGSSIVDRVLWSLHEHVPEPPDDAPVVLTMGVGGNLHDLGLRIVAQRLQLAGHRVHHLGGNMPASDLQWALEERPVDLIAISAAMVLHLSTLAATIADVRRIERVGGRARSLPILVGGDVFANVPGLAPLLGANAQAGSAEEAVAHVRALLDAD